MKGFFLRVSLLDIPVAPQRSQLYGFSAVCDSANEPEGEYAISFDAGPCGPQAVADS